MLKYKLLLAVLAVAALLCLTPQPTLSADAAITAEWYRIEKEQVYFYKTPIDTGDNVLFLLEYTYFIKPVAVSGGFFQVQLYENKNGFVKMTGYVKCADVEPYSKTPSSPAYPEVTLNVASYTTLKQTPSLYGEDICAALTGVSAIFYGKAAASGWYFVRLGNDFGYLQASKLSELTILLHPTPLVDTPVVVPPVDGGGDTETEPPRSSGLEIILILLICIPALIIVILLFLPQKNMPTKHSRAAQAAHRPKYFADGDYFDDMDLL